MREQEEVLPQLLQQGCIFQDLLELLLSHAGGILDWLCWHMKAVLEHASSVRGHQEYACRTLEILLRILEIVDHFLVLDQLSQRPNIGHPILDDFAILYLGFITDDIRSIEHLKQARLHLVGVIVLPWLESHLAEALSRQLQIHLYWKNLGQEELDIISLLRCHTGQIDVQVAKSKSFWTSLIYFADKIEQQEACGHIISFQNQLEDGMGLLS